VEQTIRHSFIASLLRIPHVVICINKMDLVEYKEEVFEKIKEDIKAFIAKLDLKDIHFIPISALNGDNVVTRSKNMEWYNGPTLMYLLENIHIASDENHIDCRFPVQYVIRPISTEYHDYRGYAGRIAGGVFNVGNNVTVLPSGLTSKIKSIDTYDGALSEGFPPMSVTLTLEDDIDISRGDMIVRSQNMTEVSQDIDMMICWFNERPLQPNGKYIIRHTTNEVRGVVKEIVYKMNISTMHRLENDKKIGMNDIGRIKIRTTKPLCFDNYAKNRITGSLIFVDEATNETVGAGMIH